MNKLKRSKAGAYAWSRHMKSLRPWFLPVILVLTFYPLFVFAFVMSGRLNWLWSLVSVLALAAIMRALSKFADSRDWSWEEGARGEFLVGEELEKLYKEGFHVFHDYFSEGRGNVDHFVVGPPGVFAVETKAWKGDVTFHNDAFLRDGRPVGKDPIKQVKGEAKDISRLIADACGVKYWVNPVLCFSHGELRHYEAVQGVEISNVGSLRSAIMRHPRRRKADDLLSNIEVNAVSRYLQRHLGEEPAAAPGHPPVSPSRLKRVFKSEWTYLVLYALFWILLSILFAGPTANVLEDLAATYRAFEILWSMH